MWDSVEQDTTKTLRNSKDELKATFTNLNKETNRKSWRRFRSHLEVDIEASGDLFEWIKSIVFQDIFMKC